MLSIDGTPGIDWFETTIFPHDYMDGIIHDLARVMGIPDSDVDVHPSKLWNYDFIACFHKMDIFMLFRATHSWSCALRSSDLFAFNGDCDVLKSVDVDENGNDIDRQFADVHLVITGVGMRYLQHDRFMDLVSMLRKNYDDFAVTRIDVCCDFFEPADVISAVDNACSNELKLFRGEDVEFGSPRINSKVRRTNLVCHQSIGGCDWYFGTRGNRSNWYFRSYNKAYEQESKHGDLAGLHEYWHRFEWECRGTAALNAFANFVENGVHSALAYCVQGMFSITEHRYDSNSMNPVYFVWEHWVYNLMHCDEVSDKVVSEPYSISVFIEYSCQTMSSINVIRCLLSCPWAFEQSPPLLDQLRRVYLKRPKYQALISDVLNGHVSYSETDIDCFERDGTSTLAVDYDYSSLCDAFYDGFYA